MFRKGHVNAEFFIFLFELMVGYGGLWYLHGERLITENLFFLGISFLSLVFALYYGIKGASAAVFCCALLLFLFTNNKVLSFLSLHYKETGFFLAALLITGFAKTGQERKAISTGLANLILDKRVEKLTLQLSEKDRALQDAFREVLTEMESPKIMYQGLRRLQHIKERETLFEEILYILYTHCHIEKSSIYETLKTGAFQRVASFGATDLPEVLKWKSELFPEILRVAATEKEMIIPKELDHRFVMAVPILSTSDALRYLLLIEEIRFINLSEDMINLLKMSVFWIRSLIERRLVMDDLLPLSAFSSVIVYKPEISKALLSESTSRYRKYALPYSLLSVTGDISEKRAGELSSSLRLYDELYLIKEGELMVLLSMAHEANAAFVIDRLKKAFPGLGIEAVKGIPSSNG